MENSKKTYRLDSIKSVRRFLSRLIFDYYQQDEITIDESRLSDTKFKNLCYSLNCLSKIIETSEIEKRIEALEQMNE